MVQDKEKAKKNGPSSTDKKKKRKKKVVSLLLSNMIKDKRGNNRKIDKTKITKSNIRKS